MSSKFMLTRMPQRLLPNDIVFPMSKETTIGYYDSETEAIDTMIRISPNSVLGNGDIRAPIATGEGGFGPWKAFSIPFVPPDIIELYTITEIT